jgi:RNA polymerase-binding transcription factor DksA
MTRVNGGWRSGALGPKARAAQRRLEQLLRRARAPERLCSDCGGAISPTRLRARPLTELCTACQLAREIDADARARHTPGRW